MSVRPHRFGCTCRRCLLLADAHRPSCSCNACWMNNQPLDDAKYPRNPGAKP